jgi:NAD(P)H-dependent flavin oxidoreductase YrpB (nitropropane dioxygenase family)
MTLRTRLCDLLGIEVPVIAAPMGFVTGPELAAAVSNAGGLGIMSFNALPPPLLRREIRRLRELTDKPFGVNLLLSFPQEENVEACLAEQVPVLSFFWGDPSPFVERAHAAGALVFDQVGSVEAARRSARAGVDVIVAQGTEAGGHVAGQVATSVLVPLVVDAVAPTPVVAAGGIGDARGLVAVLALGAEGAVLGTRLIATPEAMAHPRYKERVLAAHEDETLRTILFGNGWPNAPHRVLRTPFVEEWTGREARAQESRPDEPVVGKTRIGEDTMPVLRFMALPPSRDTSGEIDAMPLYMGQSAGFVRKMEPASDVVRALVEEARQIIEGRLARVVGR